MPVLGGLETPRDYTPVKRVTYHHQLKQNISRALAHDDDAMSSPIKKQRTTCGTPTTLLSEGIFRQRRSNIFDEETEDLLKIRRGVVLQPILIDPEDPLLEQDKDSFSLLAKVHNDHDQCCSMFPSVVVDTKHDCHVIG